MHTNTLGRPYLATLRLDLNFPPPAPACGGRVWDDLMEKLLSHPGIIDPVVSDDLDSGGVSISFEFEAAGNAQEDGLKALTFLMEATHTDELSSAFDWERWLRGPSQAGTIQYPVYA